MQIVGIIIYTIVYPAVLAIIPASLMALVMKGGRPTLAFPNALKAAFLPWYAALLVMNLMFLFYAMRGLSRHDVPVLLLLCVVIAGGWGAVVSVRAARVRTGA
ncbi:hypothetical protein [Brevundimonas poindexterae]|uniref:hypothetical protein n=1 Tax=Brevundimonas poindexterae TaxID=74325 RepID=UPI001CFD4CBC|nr:hypothetical protein [Brevundimonas poindexterae]